MGLMGLMSLDVSKYDRLQKRGNFPISDRKLGPKKLGIIC